MKEDLTGTDITMMAKGYWEQHFRWRFHPGARMWLMGAALLAVLTAIAAIVSASVEGPDIGPVGTMALVLLLLVMGLFMVAAWYYARAKEEFLIWVTTNWEKGDRTLPRTEWVEAFITRRK